MIDEEIVKKVRNKSVLKFGASVDNCEDNKIYCVEVACVQDMKDILESIIYDVVCRGWNDNFSSEILVEAVHMHEDG